MIGTVLTSCNGLVLVSIYEKRVTYTGTILMALKKSASQMVQEARERIEEIETDKLIAMMNDPDLVIVDIRDVRERQRTGFIPGSFHAPTGHDRILGRSR